MRHCLVRGRPIVLQKVVGRGPGGREHRAGDSRQCFAQRSRGGVVELVQEFAFALGNHQGVPGAQWRDIKEGNHQRALVDAVAGDLASDDARENGGHAAERTIASA